MKQPISHTFYFYWIGHPSQISGKIYITKYDQIELETGRLYVDREYYISLSNQAHDPGFVCSVYGLRNCKSLILI